MPLKRILSIQSHVVHGYCGNKSATFPLQLLEFDVDVLNSVQLSNHTQYKTARGQIFTGDDLDKIHKGLEENDLLSRYCGVISGYVADASYVEAMGRLIGDVKKAHGKFYAVDPVLGDDGVGYYVPDGPKMAEAYKKHLFPLADMITPNRFEASILSGVEIDQRSEDGHNQALKAINVLHKQYGVQIVAMTSLNLSTSPDVLSCILSHWPGVSERCNFSSRETTSSGDLPCQRDHQGSIWTVQVPKIPAAFTGTGDLFTALLTAWLIKTNFDFEKSLENTANTIHDILQDTLASRDNTTDDVDSRELRLIPNRDKILSPSGEIRASLSEPSRYVPDSLSENKVQAKVIKTSDRLPLTS